MSIFEISITPQRFLAIKNNKLRTLVTSHDTHDYAIGDIILVFPFDSDAQTFLRFDEFSGHLVPLAQATQQPLSSEGLLLEICYIDSIDSQHYAPSFQLVTHHMKRTDIFAQLEAQGRQLLKR